MNILNSSYEPAVRIDSLTAHPENPRRGNIEAVAESIDANGFYGAVIAQVSTRRILVGNHRWKAAQKRNSSFIPVLWIDCDDDRALRILLADNRTNDLAAYDDAMLVGLLQKLESETGSVVGTGYDDAALMQLVSDLNAQAPSTLGADPDVSELHEKREELRQKWGTAAGQVWDIPSSTVTGGVHRLVIADSRFKSHIETSCCHKLVDVMWTDPPYGVNYEGKTKEKLTIANDQPGEIAQMLSAVLEGASGVMRDGAPLYVCAPAGPMGLVFGQAIIGAGFHYHQMLIWLKDQMVLGHSDYHYKHEPIFYGWKSGAARTWLSGRCETTILEFPRPKASNDHPTMKPVPLIEYCLGNSAVRGARVLDPFLGSGSTMIAAEQGGRLCSGVEISPHYVAVALERMNVVTGLRPTQSSRL
jgi:DNA modification methylase